MSLYDKSTSDLTSALANLTGYISGTAQWDDTLTTKTKVRLLKELIHIWTKLDPESDITKRWVQEWEDMIKEIESKG